MASGAQIVCVALEMGPWMRDSNATEFRTILDERDAHGVCTGGEHARSIDGAREGAVAVCVPVALFAGVFSRLRTVSEYQPPVPPHDSVYHKH